MRTRLEASKLNIANGQSTSISIQIYRLFPSLNIKYFNCIWNAYFSLNSTYLLNISPFYILYRLCSNIYFKTKLTPWSPINSYISCYTYIYFQWKDSILCISKVLLYLLSCNLGHLGIFNNKKKTYFNIYILFPGKLI